MYKKFIAYKAAVENSNYYCRSTRAVCSEVGITRDLLRFFARRAAHDVFRESGIELVGSEKLRHHYYHDKLLGQNPFYQTS